MTIQEMIDKKKELGYTNETLAKISGVPLGTVQKIFAGITRAPRRSTIVALEAVLSDGEKQSGSEYSYSYENDLKADVVRESARAYGATAAVISKASNSDNPGTPAKAPYPGASGDPAQALYSGAPGAPAQALYPGAPGDPAQGTYTLDDYYALPDDRRVELIDGVIYDMASPLRIHQAILLMMSYQLYPCVASHPECEMFIAPADVCLDNDDRTILQPDLYISCGKNETDNRRFNGAPDFIIEILSPSNRKHDMILKYQKYMEAGVREYWIVDPENLKVIVYHFEKTDLPTLYTFEDTIPVKISGGECSVEFKKILTAIQRYL